MTRYYFHVVDGESAPDDIGTECDSLDDAKSLAVTAAADMIRDLAGGVEGRSLGDARG